MGLASRWVMTILKEDNAETAEKIEALVSTLESDRDHMSNIVNLLMTQTSVKLPAKDFKEICTNFESLQWYFSRDNVSTSGGERVFKKTFMGEPPDEE